MIKRLLPVMVSTAVMAGTLVLGGSASAAPAEVINQRWTCETLPSGDELCSSLRQVVHETSGPSGTQYHAIYRACAKYTSGATGQVIYDVCNTGRDIINASPYTAGTTQFVLTQEFSFLDTITGITHNCINYYNFRAANGRVISAEFTTTCDPPLPQP
jgi:hypothetical protein